jgi:hypothetical protein
MRLAFCLTEKIYELFNLERINLVRTYVMKAHTVLYKYILYIEYGVRCSSIIFKWKKFPDNTNWAEYLRFNISPRHRL